MSELHRLVIDRFEGELAVVEVDGELVLDLPRWLLPTTVTEGAVLVLHPDDDSEGRRSWTIVHDMEATESAREQASDRLRRLQERDPGGDVIL